MTDKDEEETGGEGKNVKQRCQKVRIGVRGSSREKKRKKRNVDRKKKTKRLRLKRENGIKEVDRSDDNECRI